MTSHPASWDAGKSQIEREKFKKRLETAINEEDDPLAVYNQFVQWTIKNYGEDDPNSGLLELLEQATREFKGDPVYKTDLRYLKLWSLYARQAERPGAIAIYAYLLSNDIGISYSILYEEYAALLEADGKRQEAESIYRKGIKRQARPLERLRIRYREFQSHSPSSSTLPTSSKPAITSSNGGGHGDVLRKNPLKNHSGTSRSTSTLSSSTAPTAFISHNSTAESRYALMLAPPAPGKRPEKMRFKLSLLFTEEGVEYSIQEARARSMGLLGKKWGPPPMSDSFRLSSSSSMPVNFNDDGQKSTRLMAQVGRRKSIMGGEPTVTINTKEALADVFGMYNSPERTTKMIGPGSKHAPLKKIEVMTPAPPRLQLIRENENANTPVPAFKPFVDENAEPGRKATDQVTFTPFVDPDPQNTPFSIPRATLSLKGSATQPGSQLKNENVSRAANKVLRQKSTAGESNGENVFSSKVFAPAQFKSSPLTPFRDGPTADEVKLLSKTAVFTHSRVTSHHDTAAPSLNNDIRAPALMPFTDENAKTPFKVFSRPPENSENNNAITPKAPGASFKPFSDPKPAFVPFRDGPVAFTPFRDQGALAPKYLAPGRLTPPELVVDIEENVEESESDREPESSVQYEEEYQYDNESPQQQYEVPSSAEIAEPQYEEDQSFQEAPLGGRFGQFNVMTPITERTFEFTTSTRGVGTPSERLRYPSENGDPTYQNVFVPHQRDEHGAIAAAEQLAAELREDSEEYDGEEPLEPLQYSTLTPPKEDIAITAMEEKTGSLSLSDTLTLNSKFRPPNPCNPFDPPIMTALLSRIPADPHYYDLGTQQANMLDGLQKFAKKGKKTSGNTSRGSGGMLDISNFPLTLNGHKFLVSEKLGEGGFGAVFKAQDLGTQDHDSDEDFDSGDEDEGLSMVALKVVKPRNLWEYHALRRLHSALPPLLRRSVILPHALYAFHDESYLALDLCPQGTLLNIVNGAVAAGVSQQGGSLDELLVMFFSIELLRLLEAIHAAGFIHGDLKVDNCLLRLEDVPGGASAWSSTYQPSGEGGWSFKGLKVIDFGRTIDTRLFPSSQQYIAEWPTDERDCFEIRESRPWTYQADYFGLAGIIYCMLFGKYIQESSVALIPVDGGQRYKISTPLKRYWQIDLWNKLFDALLNPCLIKPDCDLPVSEELGFLRREMEKWLQENCNRTSNTLKGLLKKVEVSCYVR